MQTEYAGPCSHIIKSFRVAAVSTKPGGTAEAQAAMGHTSHTRGAGPGHWVPPLECGGTYVGRKVMTNLAY